MDLERGVEACRVRRAIVLVLLRVGWVMGDCVVSVLDFWGCGFCGCVVEDGDGYGWSCLVGREYGYSR